MPGCIHPSMVRSFRSIAKCLPAISEIYLGVRNVVVAIQFLSGVFPLAEMAGFTPFLLQLLALRLSTCLVSGRRPFSNQSSLFPHPLASFRSSSVVLAFSCHSLQDSEQPSKHYSHSSLARVTIRPLFGGHVLLFGKK